MRMGLPEIKWTQGVLHKGGHCPRCSVRIRHGDGRAVNVLQSNKGGLYCTCCEVKVGEVVLNDHT